MGDKYDFIKELLENKKIKPNQRERILELAATEIGNEGTFEERIIEIEKIVFNDKQKPLVKTIPLKEEPEVEDVEQTINDFYLMKKSEVEDEEQIVKTIILKEEPESNNEDQEGEIETETSKPTRYSFPLKLYQFLFEYNQNKILRSTCHDIDSDTIDVINEYCNTELYDFIKHRKMILEAYEIHEKKYFAPHQVKAMIRGYLTGKDYKGNELITGWSTDKIKIHWQHPDLLTWTNKNPNLPPNLNEEILGNMEVLGFEFKQINSKIFGKTIQNFSELVLHFKHLFHIRHDNSLREIIERKNENEGWNEKIDFDINKDNFPRNIELFTDVEKLVQAYKRIIRQVIEQHNEDSQPKVKLIFSEVDGFVSLSIHHLNNNYNKTIKATVNRGLGQDYSALIEKQVNGLCDLYLKANFGKDGCFEVNLWNGKERTKKEIDYFEGVEHILKFQINK